MGNPRARLWAALFLIVGASGLGGCAVPIKVADVSSTVPHDAPPIAIKSSLEALDDAENKKRIQHILASAEMKAVEKEMASGILDASLASLDEPSRRAKISKISEQYATGLIGAMSREMNADLGPIARSLAQSAVRGALDEAMGDHRDVAGPTQDSGLRGMIREQLAPAIADVLKDAAFQQAMGDVARVMGREAVVGANQGLKEVQAEAANRDSSLLSRVTSLASGGAHVMSTLTWALVALVILLGVWSVKMMFQIRKSAKVGPVGTVSEASSPGPVVEVSKRPSRPNVFNGRARHRVRAVARHVVPRSTH